ncbi:TGF-beta-activated kinase 1 and MAP3K7-binding protein 2 isoform X2 [Diachasmimorpha longicaudata]|uniref:TGF-beta-activated kinase 1 and MAP3K7-binding protein 2 isoform X2 n=1 Tax=Diachasmimorpha longicaudata TaxID=58733 RepID=UPI0030B8BC00
MIDVRHDREICTRSLRAAQDLRSSPGAFPPPAPEPLPSLYDINNERNNDDKIVGNTHRNHQRPHRPNSLHIGKSRQCNSPNNSRLQFSPATSFPSRSTASSAVSNYSSRALFEDLPNPTVASTINVVDKSGNNCGGEKPARGFELNVNVACSPASNSGQIPRLSRTDLVGEQLSHYTESRLAGNHDCETVDHTRGYTSVSLILRPPSSEPQPPIDIRSQGSSLTYSTSSSDARGFQSRLLISIGPGKVGSVAAARIKSRMGHTRPNSLLSAMQSTSNQSTGVVVGPSSHFPRPSTSSAKSGSLAVGVTIPNTVQNCPTLPTTSSATTSSITTNHIGAQLDQVTDNQKKLITEQLKRKERLAHELRMEKLRLEAMKKDLQILLRPVDPAVPTQGLKKKLRSEIYQLQVECDRLADEVDQRSDPRVPFGETNEEFYQGIYTGQSLNIPSFTSRPRPPLPAVPPAWEPQGPRIHPSNHDRDDRDGPSWVCRMCTFDNHPLMDKCEQCDMPKFRLPDTGETQDIHIRVTRHHNFSPRRTLHSWVV